MSPKSERERQISAVLLVAYAALMLGLVILEFALVEGRPIRMTLQGEFLEKSSLSYVMSLFLAYLVIGGLGFVGTIGLVRTYGSGAGLLADVATYSAVAYFVTSYWLWSAVWIVQHKITLLTTNPTNPDEWLLHIFDASNALWALPAWGSFGAALTMFVSVGLLLLRGARQLPQWSGWGFLVLAVSQFASLVYVGLRGFGVSGPFAFYNDTLLTFGRIAVFVMAAAALYGEEGLFVRTRRV